MRQDSTRGTIVLESSYCMALSILVVFFLISYGFFLYQRSMVYVAANEIAEEIGQTYKLENVADASSVTADDVANVGNYRYSLCKNSFLSSNLSKGLNLAETRLMKSSLAKDEGGLQVEIRQVADGVFRQHYEITVSKQYSLLLGKLLKEIGQDEKQVMSTTVYVESVDVLSYTNAVRLEKFATNEVKEGFVLANIYNNAIQVLSFLQLY